MKAFIDIAMDIYNTAENNVCRATQEIKSIGRLGNGTS